ncbi:MAG: hypothetical protein Q9195_006837 [Heterodermia aff. obscurata]
MSGKLQIRKNGRKVYQSDLNPANLPKLRPEFLATERVKKPFYGSGFLTRLSDPEAGNVLGNELKRGGHPISDAVWEEVQMMMLTAIAEYFLENMAAEIQWGRLGQAQTTSISDKFAQLCGEKGGPFAGLSSDLNLVKNLRNMLQHYVFRRTKRGEGPAIFLCLMVGEGTLHLALYILFVVSLFDPENTSREDEDDDDP